MSPYDRWLTTQPEPRCPQCGAPLEEEPEHDPETCDGMEPEPIEVGDRNVEDW